MKDAHIPRRKFLKYPMAGTAIALSSGTVNAATETQLQPKISNNIDVLVVGGGAAGTIAAI